MKRFVKILLVCLLIFTPVCYADSWDDIGDIERMWDGQQSITNKDFEEVMNVLESDKKKKEAKKKEKKIKKISGGGTSLHKDMAPDKNITEIANISDEQDNLLNIPVQLIIDKQIMETGYYNVTATKEENNKIYIHFYQSQYLKGSVEAQETNDDFNEETVNFVRIIPYNDSFVKIVYGSMKFNAYAYVPFYTGTNY